MKNHWLLGCVRSLGVRIRPPCPEIGDNETRGMKCMMGHGISRVSLPHKHTHSLSSDLSLEMSSTLQALMGNHIWSCPWWQLIWNYLATPHAPSFPSPVCLSVCLSLARRFFLCLFPASRLSLPPNAPLEPVLHAPAIKLIPHIFPRNPHRSRANVFNSIGAIHIQAHFLFGCAKELLPRAALESASAASR